MTSYSRGTRILLLMPTGYGGFGGIAQHDRDLIDALAEWGDLDAAVLLPWSGDGKDELPPAPFEQRAAPDTKLGYAHAAVRLARELRPDVIICGHISLLPVAALAKRVSGRAYDTHLWLETHGIEVWDPRGTRWRRLLAACDLITTVSRYTRRRLLEWCELPESRIKVCSNTIRLESFSPGDRQEYLEERYGVRGRRVLMTVARMALAEGYKGQDRVLQVLPRLLDRYEDLTYVVVGDGDDRPRLEEMARDLGVRRRVVFTGRIPEHEKLDHYRLADAFAMPSTGEGFGLAFLEAAACGVPVLGGNVDGSCDALVDGQLGVACDPRDSEQLLAGLIEVLEREPGVPADLARFDFPHFRAHVHRLLASPELGRAPGRSGQGAAA